MQNSFAREIYANASKRARGLSTCEDFNPNFTIFEETLVENEIFNTLTDLERDSIIDLLLK